LNWLSLRGEVSFLLDTERTRNANDYCKDLFEFLKLLKKCAFVKLGLNKISTYSYAHRAYHVSAIEKAGFTREGVLREDTQVDGKWVDAILASCLRSEFEKS
jgi:RimJ/RimL family protein N-acetyltransferase